MATIYYIRVFCVCVYTMNACIGRACVYVCMFVCVCVYIYTYMCTYRYIRVRICMYVSVSKGCISFMCDVRTCHTAVDTNVCFVVQNKK